ncbi:MAG: lipoyl protein ligase domain-containing protein [Acidimicrobiales bacterium]
MAGSWLVEQAVGTAAHFHARSLPDPATRSVEVLEVDRGALVLGSTQAEADADRGALRAAGIDLVRRRSGGGAVLLVPGQSLWVDVVVPRSDPLWDDDVGRAAHWLGRAWAAALATLGVDATVHTEGLVATRWSPLVCFAGLGPGEVTSAGRKLVGIASRRSRAGARFQCVVVRRWDPAALLGLLAMDDDDRVAAHAEVAGAAAGVEAPFPEVLDALLACLPGR